MPFLFQMLEHLVLLSLTNMRAIHEPTITTIIIIIIIDVGVVIVGGGVVIVFIIIIIFSIMLLLFIRYVVPHLLYGIALKHEAIKYLQFNTRQTWELIKAFFYCCSNVPCLTISDSVCMSEC